MRGERGVQILSPLGGLLLELLPLVGELGGPGAHLLAREVSLGHQVVGVAQHGRDPRLVVVDLGDDRLVFLGQVLHADQVTA